MEPRLKLKTYSHFGKKFPTDYELATSRLLYSASNPPEVRTPVVAWYEKYQKGSPLQCSDWEKFHDPRATTYTTYVSFQQTKEAFLNGIFASIEETQYDFTLSKEWRCNLANHLSALRFPCHGLQMIAAYVGQLAPASRIVIASLFQSADEMRRIQRFALRLGQLRIMEANAAEIGREFWQTDSAWQPLRKLIEKLLITYDWGEAFVALNFCLKPAFDSLVLDSWAAFAKANGDFIISQILRSLAEDSLWHRQWTTELRQVIERENPENISAINAWLACWKPQAEAAITMLASRLCPNGPGVEAEK